VVFSMLAFNLFNFFFFFFLLNLLSILMLIVALFLVLLGAFSDQLGSLQESGPRVLAWLR
jgi:hypothetical protein